jgi:hypothetical protein
MQRARVAVAYMVSKGANSSKSATLRIVNKIVAEAITDASEIPAPIAEFYMKQLSALMFWVACGEWSADIPKPEDFSG